MHVHSILFTVRIICTVVLYILWNYFEMKILKNLRNIKKSTPFNNKSLFKYHIGLTFIFFIHLISFNIQPDDPTNVRTRESGFSNNVTSRHQHKGEQTFAKISWQYSLNICIAPSVSGTERKYICQINYNKLQLIWSKRYYLDSNTSLITQLKTNCSNFKLFEFYQ